MPVQFKIVPSLVLRRFVCTTVPGETLKFENQSLCTGTSLRREAFSPVVFEMGLQ